MKIQNISKKIGIQFILMLMFVVLFAPISAKAADTDTIEGTMQNVGDNVYSNINYKIIWGSMVYLYGDGDLDVNDWDDFWNSFSSQTGINLNNITIVGINYDASHLSHKFNLKNIQYILKSVPNVTFFGIGSVDASYINTETGWCNFFNYPTKLEHVDLKGLNLATREEKQSGLYYYNVWGDITEENLHPNLYRLELPAGPFRLPNIQFIDKENKKAYSGADTIDNSAPVTLKLIKKYTITYHLCPPGYSSSSITTGEPVKKEVSNNYVQELNKSIFNNSLKDWYQLDHFINKNNNTITEIPFGNEEDIEVYAIQKPATKNILYYIIKNNQSEFQLCDSIKVQEGDTPELGMIRSDSSDELVKIDESIRGYHVDKYYSDENLTNEITDNKLTVAWDGGNATKIYITLVPDTYTIIYDLPEDSVNTENPASFTVEDDEITLQNPTRPGYNFMGWYTNPVFTASSKVTSIIPSTKYEDITLYAKWECNHELTEKRDERPATCTQNGYSGDIYCKNCDTLVKKGTHVFATGHSWDEGRITKTATATEDGEKTYSCTKCTETKTEVIPALGESHFCDFSSDWQQNDNHHWKTCVCGEISDKEEHTWDNGRITKEPTETETGVKKYTCTVCEKQKEEIIPVIKTECKHTNTEKRDERQATCTTSGYTGDIYCADCGEPLTSGQTIEATGHTWDEGIVVKEPTYTENGQIKHICLVCGTEEIVSDNQKKVCPHDTTEVRDAKQATCKEEGYTGDTYCKDCGKKLSTGKAIEKTDHKWDEGVVTKRPTYESAGEKTHTCTVCNEKKTTLIPMLEKNENQTVEEKKNSKTEAPDKVTNLKVKNQKKNSLQVTFKKVSGAKYQLQYSTDKKFKKSVKKKDISKTTYTIKGLKKGKTYYVRVRAYKTVDGKTVYGNWSAVKKVKIKK